MTIIPDTKDWTWVLQRPCPECGFTVETFAATSYTTRCTISTTSPAGAP